MVPAPPPPPPPPLPPPPPALPETESIAEPCSSGLGGAAAVAGGNYSAIGGGNYTHHVSRTPTPATLLPEDLNEIITDADLEEEANKRLQEEKDAVRV